jgi:hypothetical protein
LGGQQIIGQFGLVGIEFQAVARDRFIADSRQYGKTFAVVELQKNADSAIHAEFFLTVDCDTFTADIHQLGVNQAWKKQAMGFDYDFDITTPITNRNSVVQKQTVNVNDLIQFVKIINWEIVIRHFA